MKFATLDDGSRDGTLVVVSRDLRQAVSAAAIVPTLLRALEDWDAFRPALQALSDALNAGTAPDAFAFDAARALSPLPRTTQFVDASAFLNHGEIMEKAYQLTVKKTEGIPIMIQRQSDDFGAPLADYPFPAEDDGCDFEGEFAVALGDVPMGCSAREAERAIRLVLIFNDVSMRTHLFRELQMGFGLINAKPAAVFAPVAVTPDELGPAWRDGRVHLDMRVSRNGEPFEHPNGREMDWGFGELIAHLAYNRNLRAGTIVGSGTVSNRDVERVGSACLAERRALEKIAGGAPVTPFIRYGERLRFECLDDEGISVFGAVDHRFVPAARGPGKEGA